MKLEISLDSKESLKSWKQAKGILNKLKKVLTPEVIEKYEKDPESVNIPDLIGEKLSWKLFDFYADMLQIFITSEIKEIK
jgi:hypothetical protein